MYGLDTGIRAVDVNGVISNVLMDEIGPQYTTRDGGYTRIVNSINNDRPTKSRILSVTIVPNAVGIFNDDFSAKTYARKNSPILKGRTELPK